MKDGKDYRIEDHKFEDTDIYHASTYGNNFIDVKVQGGDQYHFYKKDVIAMAKHFKLNEGDFK